MLFEENSSQSIVKMKIDLKTDFQVSQPLPPTEITKNQVNKQSSKQIQHIGKTFDHCYPFHYIYLEFMKKPTIYITFRVHRLFFSISS